MQLKNSFRLRIAVLSAILAGTALIGFGGVSWGLIYQSKLARLDSEIKNQLWRGTFRTRRQLRENWDSHARSLPTFFSGTSPNYIGLMVVDNKQKLLYLGDNFPEDIDLKDIFLELREIAVRSRSFLPVYPEEQRPLLPDSSEEQRQFLPPPPRAERLNQLSKIVTKTSKKGQFRIGVITSPLTGLAIAVNMSEIDREMGNIRNIFVISIPVLLILIAIGSWYLSGSVLKTINQITLTIQGVTAKGLDQRIPIINKDIEFRELLTVFNQMMERLERSFLQASRFSADAAHELKTPLAILQGVLERTLQQAEPGSEMQENLSNLLDEVHRLSAIVRKLLLLSLADAGKMKLHLIDVDLSTILNDLSEDIEILAPELELTLQIMPKLRVKADRDLLIQVLHNLISNAIKYNVDSGWIAINTYQKNALVFVTVSNSSKDIVNSDRTAIFDRFHRGDPARNRKIEGLGLGLSLAREIIRAHGGDLQLDETPSGQTAFTLFLRNN
jgi:two-component system, OmpR family, heavy metal sensor histidine kinase CusS